MLATLDYPVPQGGPLLSRSNGAFPSTAVQPRKWNYQGAVEIERPPLFSGILPGDYMKFVAAARVKTFARGQMLYIEGDYVQQVLMLTSGFVKLKQYGQSGMSVILRIGVRGDVLGATELFSTGRHCSTAQASRPCRALVWEATAFKTLVGRYPVLHQNMARILGGDLLELEERFREVATERVSSRVASQLLRLVKRIGWPANGGVEIEVSRDDLAQMTGTTLYTVSRLLSAWAALEMVTLRREAVTICNAESLLAMSAL
jgi:CRP/FNR family transcriptional regulator, nitrogen oxide reductase regulator